MHTYFIFDSHSRQLWFVVVCLLFAWLGFLLSDGPPQQEVNGFTLVKVIYY